MASSLSRSRPRPHPDREDRRRQTLRQYDALEAPPTEAFDRVTRLAARLFDVPMAMVNVVDREHQWCLSSRGLDLDRVDREVSFCAGAIEQSGVLVVEDARADDRFADNPLVTGPPHIRFYAGAPLTAPNGYRLGTLCLLDDEPRSFTAGNRSALADLAGVVMDELTLRHHAPKAARQARPGPSEQPTRILESITDAFVAVDDEWTLTYVNAQAEAFLERAREDLLGRTLWNEFPEAMGSTFEKKYERAVAENTTVEFVEHYPPLDRWFEVKAFPFDDGLSIYFDDVTDRMEARESLRRERDLTEAVMDTSIAAVVIVDASGRISFANEPASTILGTDVDALTGRSHRETGTLRALDGTPLPPGDWPFERILETGEPLSEQRYVFEGDDGDPRYISVNGAPLRDPDDAIRQVVFSIEDITGQVRHERELKAAKEEAERANRLKSAFLANVSHDVQTPLSSIVNHADLLRMEAGDEHQDRIDLIKRSSTRLLDTLESVLDLSRLEAGAVEATPEAIDLADELLGTAEIFQPQATGRNLALETDVEEPLRAELDPTMLHRITDNLLSNALKFTEPGGTVRLRAWAEKDGVVVEVEDTGVGIDEAFRPSLFEPFSRAEEQATTDGTGLGLAITKHLTDVMGGRIDVESEPGVGTTVTVRLPR
jgi:PAS domain S-box-containing protein